VTKLFILPSEQSLSGELQRCAWIHYTEHVGEEETHTTSWEDGVSLYHTVSGRKKGSPTLSIVTWSEIIRF